MQNALTLHNQNTELAELADVSQLLAQFALALDLRVRAGEIASNTALAYTRGADRFITWSNAQGLSTSLADTVREWKAALLEKGTKPAAINTWLAGVRALFAWAHQSGLIAYNPASSIKGAQRKGTKKRHTRESLTDLEARRVLAMPDTGTKQGLRDCAILSLMLYTAIRGIELHRAELADLQTQGGKLVLMVQGKGHQEKDDFVVIAHAEQALRDWLGVRGSKPGALFCSISNRSAGERLSLQALRALVKHYFSLAGVQGNKSTHSLRHTAISKAIAAGVPLHKVSKGLARHASMDTTLIYVHELDRLTDPAESYITYGSE
jgi:integrase/recombinase XerD